MGMSVSDFDLCTPSEFEQACESWHRRRESEERSRWERMRQLAACLLQPYSERVLRAEDVMTFDWERAPKSPVPIPPSEDSPADAAAERARYEEVKKKRGLK